MGKKTGVLRKTRVSKSKESRKIDESNSYEYDTSTRRSKRGKPSLDEGDGSSEDDVVEEDESIDDDGSDIGWDSDDEMVFGKLVALNKSKSKSKSKTGKDGMDSDEEKDNESESDQEEVQGEGEMLLSDMLGMNTSTQSKTKTKNRSSSGVQDGAMEEVGESGSESDNGNEFEYIGSENNDEDLSPGSSSDSDSDADSDSDSDGDSDQKEDHGRLLAAISKFSGDSDGGSWITAGQENLDDDGWVVAGQEGSSSSSSSAKPGEISIQDLLDPLKDSKSHVATIGAIQKKMLDLESAPAAPLVVERVKSDRIQRTVQYETTSNEMMKWQKQVMNERAMKTLDLAKDRRSNTSHQKIITSFSASTDLEKEVQMVMVKHGMTEEDMAEDEEANLLDGGLTQEEIASRQAELSKAKSLLFYEQMKRHRINKIKSKAYRRIRKKQREREKAEEEALLETTDPGALDDRREDEVRKRIMERMSLKHKNTSDWAKMALKHGHHDKSLRQAYHESVQLGNELSKRFDVDVTQGSSKGEADDSGDEGNTNLQDDLEDARANADEELPTGSKYDKLLQMDFMRSAREKQKARAMDEAKNVLRELNDMDESDDDSNHNGVDDIRDGISEESLAKARAKMSSVLSGGFGMMGKSVLKEKGEEVEAVEITTNPWLTGPIAPTHSLGTPSRKDVRKGKTGIKADKAAGSGDDAVSKFSKSKDSETAAKKRKMINNNGHDENHGNKKEKDEDNENVKEMEPKKDKKEKKEKLKLISLVDKSQEELVEEAFVGPDFEEEYQNLKSKAVEEELGVDKKRANIHKEVKSGWGDWASPGETGMIEGSSTLAKKRRLMTRLDKDVAARKAKRLDAKKLNVMVSERRIKTASSLKIASVPHPFKSRAEYERSLQMPVGKEWNTSRVVQKNTKPAVIKRAGRLIAPAKLN
jgi:U3 small nucleolar RNA-associated protein 14